MTRFSVAGHQSSLAAVMALMGTLTAFCFFVPALVRANERFDQQIASVIARASRSVVSVQTATLIRGGGYNTVLTQPYLVTRTSGVVIDTGGFIACAAAAVVKTDSITVVHDGIAWPAHVVSVDYRTGIALLRVGARHLQPVALPAQGSTRAEMTLLLGVNDQGALQPEIGFSSMAAQPGRIEFSGTVEISQIGSGIFTMNGELAGIVITPGGGSAGGRPVALSSSRVMPVVSRLQCCGDRTAGYLGVQTVTTELRGYDIPSASRAPRSSATLTAVNSSEMTPVARSTRAALVTEVTAGSSAALSGIVSGDVILSCDGSAIENSEELRDFIIGCRPDSLVSLGILRNGSYFARTVRLTAAPLEQSCPIPAGGAGAGSSYSNDPVVDSLLQVIRRMDERLRLVESRQRSPR